MLQRVSLDLCPLVFDVGNVHEESVGVGQRLTALRHRELLERDEEGDEIPELAPPVGVERLPRAHQPGVQRGREVIRHRGGVHGEPEDPAHHFLLAGAADGIAAGDEEMDIQQLRGQLHGAAAGASELSLDLGEEVVLAQIRLLHEIPNENPGIAESRPRSVREQAPLLQEAAVPPRGSRLVNGLG